jgi:cytochrome c peroxidase
MASVIKAIAAFQRSIVSVDSRYDRYLQGKAALSAAEQRGMSLFFGERAECHHCHGSFNFNDQVVHARAVGKPRFTTPGFTTSTGPAVFLPQSRALREHWQAEDMGAFRAPSLRNVAVTGPYMHDGSIATLEQVIVCTPTVVASSRTARITGWATEPIQERADCQD